MNGQVLNLVLSLSLFHTCHWKFFMVPHGKELSEDEKKIVALHKDGIGWFHSEQALSCSTKEVECTCSASYPEVVFGK